MGVVIMVRHGQASFGEENYDKLSALGQRQARRVAERLADRPTPIRCLVSGSLVRQRTTAAEIATVSGLDIEVDARWDEYDHVGILGARADTLVFDAMKSDGARERAGSTLDEAVRRWIADDVTGTESHGDFVVRCRDALDSLTARSGTTVVATSGGVIAVLCVMLLGQPLNSWPAMARVMVNCGMTKIVSGRQGVSLVTFNDHAHLEANPELITYR